jgi:hypothetical protein
VVDGTLHHHEIIKLEDGYHLSEGEAFKYPTMAELVAFYSSVEGQDTTHLECRLRAPIKAAPASPQAQTFHEKPSWLQTNMAKAAALQVNVLPD